jgi:phosphate transport system protein
VGPFLQREIEKLKKKILTLGALVEENLINAFEVVEKRDGGLAAKVVDGDFAIDLMEVEIEEDCLKLLALYQPVAIDLRIIVAVIKITNTLERVGDLAVNVAEHARRISSVERAGLTFDTQSIIDKSLSMFSRALDALVRNDSILARAVLADDDEVDDLDDVLNRQLRSAMHEHPEALDALIGLLFISRYIERLADHATTIAEDVVYMVEGEIPRHHMKRLAAEEMGLSSDGLGVVGK